MDRELFGWEFATTFGEVVSEGDEQPYGKSFTAHAAITVDDKAAEDEGLIVEGYASTKFEDRHNEIIVPRAYRSSLADFKKRGVILYGHYGMPVGTPKTAKVDGQGLYLRAKIEDETPDEQVIASKVRRGLLKSFSVGFITKAAKWVEVLTDEGKKRSIRMITDLELLEVSIVPIPANRQSVFSISKALNSTNGTDVIGPTADEGEGLAPLGGVAKTLTDVSEAVEWKLAAMKIDNIARRVKR